MFIRLWTVIGTQPLVTGEQPTYHWRQRIINFFSFLVMVSQVHPSVFAEKSTALKRAFSTIKTFIFDGPSDAQRFHDIFLGPNFEYF